MCVALVSVCVLANTAVSQIGTERVADPKKEARKQAMRLIRALELPDKRADAAPKLLKLGQKAVPSRCTRAYPRRDLCADLSLLPQAKGARFFFPCASISTLVANGARTRMRVDLSMA